MLGGFQRLALCQVDHTFDHFIEQLVGGIGHHQFSQERHERGDHHQRVVEDLLQQRADTVPPGPTCAAVDIAGGTGDLARKFSQLVGPTGHVVLADINASMLKVGRDRLLDKGVAGNIEFVQADAEKLPFPDNHFDCVTIAFGLRNVTHKEDALRSMLRVLKPGGRLLVLEFSKPTNALMSKVYDAYSFAFMPMVGKLVLNDADSYRYLAESIRMHPNQETLKSMMVEAGFDRVTYHNMTSGIVALHRGIKP